MGKNAGRDFASLLDDLFVEKGVEEQRAVPPSMPFDYLSVVDELHSGRIKVSSDTATAEYRAVSDFEAELAALLQGHPAVEEDVATPLPTIEPEAIAQELGLHKMKTSTDFGRLRRSFAFKNHPDRVAPHLRQRAMVRMQVANMMIDEAKRRAKKERSEN